MNNSEKIFNKNLEILINHTKSIDTKLFDISMKQDLDEHLSLLTLMTTELINEISTIINTILFSKNNAIHPLIITPEQFVNELKKTVTHLPMQTKYPLELTSRDASELLSISNLVSYYMNDKLIFIIKTPLITQTNYDLYNVVPIPISNSDNTFIFILPNFKYFMISSNKLHYANIEDLSDCKKLSDNYRFICKLNTPLYSVHGNKVCETELMFNNMKIPMECDTRISKINGEQWYKLFHKNTWMFVIPRKITTTLNCKNKEPVDLSLSDTGILSISDNCKL